MNQTFEKLSPVILLLARVVIGYMFLLHGVDKLLGASGLPTLILVGGVIETVGGALLMLGLFTRPAVFVMAGQMAYAYFFMHLTADTIFNPLANKGELAVVYCMAFLMFLVTGAGAISLDAKRAKN